MTVMISEWYKDVKLKTVFKNAASSGVEREQDLDSAPVFNNNWTKFLLLHT